MAKVIYLDNSSTTFMSDSAKNAMVKWMDSYNPSSSSKYAKSAKDAITATEVMILKHCHVSIDTHYCLFTSGGSESNCFAIRACVDAYNKKLKSIGSFYKPHVIISSIEHHSIIECVHNLDIEVTEIKPNMFGYIKPDDVKEAIKKNTCLISVMFANNEIPIILDIAAIGKIANEHRIPFHCDAVQTFGKIRVDISKYNIHMLSASAHKFYGPKGVGVLVVNRALVEGYKITAMISGSQQHTLRGGTENVCGILSMSSALSDAFINREAKNEKLHTLKIFLMDELKKLFKFADLQRFINEEIAIANDMPYYIGEGGLKYGGNELTHEAFFGKIGTPKLKTAYDDISTIAETESSGDTSDYVKYKKLDLYIVPLGPPLNAKYKGITLPGTTLISICKTGGHPFCNVDLKHDLDEMGIIVSIGSACLTSNTNASHVLEAIGAPKKIKRGVIRISFSDHTTKSDITTFVRCFETCVMKQVNKD